MSTRKLLVASAGLMALATSAHSRGISLRADEQNPTAMIAQLQGAHKEFTTAMDARMVALEKDQGTAELDGKIEKLQAAMDEADGALKDIAAKVAAAQLGPNSGVPQVENQDQTDAFQAFMQRGERHMSPEVLANLVSTPESDGGFLAPVEWDRTITDDLVEVSDVRSVFNVVPVTGRGFKKLINLKGTTSGWVGGTTARTETSTPTFAELAIGWGELYAMPASTQNMLDDSIPNLEEWLAGEVREQFALQEGAAVIAGNGTNKPKGFLTYVTGGANAGENPLGDVELIGSGAVGGITSAALIDLVYAPAAKYRQGASFTMNRGSLRDIRKLTDGDSNYLWQPSYQMGQPSTLLGYAVNEIEDMPAIANGAIPISFGDHKAAYTIFDRQGVVVLRDPFTSKPYVLFYTTKRVGGALVDPNAVRFIEIASA